MGAVPFPQDGSGTKTQSALGIMRYQQDMRELLPQVRQVLYAMRIEGTDLAEEDFFYVDPDRLLSGIEAWVEANKQQGWKRRFGIVSFIKEASESYDKERYDGI